MPEIIKKTRNASTTFNLFGEFSTYELYSVDSGEDGDVDADDDAEARALDAANDGALDPLGGMTVGSVSMRCQSVGCRLFRWEKTDAEVRSVLCPAVRGPR